ncbi:hypothetical protein ACFLYV_02185 [Chloroflexota bacterium]
MFGWRARIGYIMPGPYLYSQEWDKVLPEGVVWAVASLGVASLTRKDFERAFNTWLTAAESLISRDVDVIICGGTPIQLTMGYEKSLEAAKHIQEKTGVPTFLQLEAVTDALQSLSAKTLVAATPYGSEHNEAHKKHFDKLGLQTLNMKGLGLKRNVEITKQPSYASYRLARESFNGAPQADAIWIGCPVWPIVSNLSSMESDFGKPVVTDVTSAIWKALTTLGIKGPAKGYGKLLEAL